MMRRGHSGHARMIRLDSIQQMPLVCCPIFLWKETMGCLSFQQILLSQRSSTSASALNTMPITTCGLVVKTQVGSSWKYSEIGTLPDLPSPLISICTIPHASDYSVRQESSLPLSSPTPRRQPKLSVSSSKLQASTMK
jgi:hypothetical protein